MDVPGYTVIREVGHGGMATVYLATQESLQRRVALKVMNPELACDSDFRARFLREAQVIARLSHPGIVTVHDFGSRGDVYFLSMEFLSDGTLKERIASGLTPDGAAQILVPIARALAHAHRQGVVHRDVKPLNILFRTDGSPVLTDFGIARLVTSDTQLTAAGFTVGSPRYMSPEQVLGQTIDGRSDLFSLGIVFYEMLTGEVPWVDTDNPISIALKRCNEPIPTLPHTLHKYQAAVDRLVAKSPADRFADADAFADALLGLKQAEHHLTDSQPTVLCAPQQAAEQTTGKTPVRKWLFGAAGAIAAAALGWGIYVGLVTQSPKEATNSSLALDLPAVVGERPIASLYEKLAIEHLRNRQFEQSSQMIGIGLRSAPTDARLLALQDIVKKFQVAATHLEAAIHYADDDMLEAGSLEVEQGLALVPGDPKLLRLREKLQAKRKQRDQREASRLLAEAKGHLRSGDLDGSLARITEALALVNNDQELLSLRRTVEDAIARRRKVDALLAQARQLEDDERWDDSLTLINKGLSIDPQNAALQASKTRVEDRLRKTRIAAADNAVEKATAELKAGELSRSLSTIQHELQSFPGHSGLLKLRREVLGAIDRATKTNEILANATAKANAGDLEASRQLLAEGLRLAPTNDGLVTLQKRVDVEMRERIEQQVEDIVAQAEAAKEKGELEHGLDLIANGLKLTPGNAKLLELQSDLGSQLDEQNRRKKEVEALLATAHKAMDADAPKDALRAVEQVLARLPNQPDALALKAAAQGRLDELDAQVQAAECLRDAERELVEGHLEKARQKVSEGLENMPGDTALTALKTKIENKVRTRRQVLDLMSSARAKQKEGAFQEGLGLLDKAHDLDPQNAEILTLREEITRQAQRQANEQHALKLKREAKKALDNGNLDESRALIEQALVLVPGHPQLVALRKQLEAKAAEAEQRHQKISSLVSRAHAKQSRGDLVGGLALAEQALRIAPEDPELVKLVAMLHNQIDKAQLAKDAVQKKEQAAQEQASDFLQQARREQQSGQLAGALALVREGLEVAPAHEELLTLEKQLSDTIATETKISNRLTKCDKHLSEGRLTTGSPGAAFDCYKEILSLQPNNQAAVDGLMRIADKYASWAGAALDKGKLSSAKTYLDRLQTVNPQSPDLASLRQRAERLARTQQEKALAKRRPPRTVRKHEPTVARKTERAPNREATDDAIGRSAVESKPQPAPSVSEPPRRSRVWGTF